jgi:hypothetical protein
MGAAAQPYGLEIMVGAGRFERPTPCAQGISPEFSVNRLFSSDWIFN